MIISRTPFRVSFFGGGTDFPDWYHQYGGAVLSTTIDKYCYISCRYLPPFFSHKHRIVYSQIENVHTLDEIKHPAVREVLKWLNLSKGIEIHHDGDLPARSGLGSSSSFSVGLLNVLYALSGHASPKRKLANDAIFVEQNLLNENVGSQDQISAAFGGLNKIIFHENGQFDVLPVIMRPQRLKDLNERLILLFTGFTRFSSDIIKSQINRIDLNKSNLLTMRTLVDDGLSILQNEDINLDEFGDLLNQTWNLKRKLSHDISTQEIDDIYDRALKAGAIGGKLLGAGGGGFLLIYARPDMRGNILSALPKFTHVPFSFETQGSQIVLYQPDGL